MTGHSVSHPSTALRLIARLLFIGVFALLMIAFLVPAQTASATAPDPTNPDPGIAPDLPPLDATAGPVQTCANIYFHAAEGINVSVNLNGPNGATAQARTPYGSLDLGGSTPAYVFCTDLHHDTTDGLNYCLDTTFFSDWRIAWVVTNYPPMLNDRKQQAARQAAVWYLTDGYSLDRTKPTTDPAINGAVLGYYDAILNSIPTTQPADYGGDNLSLALSPAADINFLPGQELHYLTATLTRGTDPIPGVTLSITLTTSDGGALPDLSVPPYVTDANGQVKFSIYNKRTSNKDFTTTINVQATLTTKAGSRFISSADPTGKQRLVLGGDTEITVNAKATKTWKTFSNGIVVHKYNDLNFNQVQDNGEPNLSNWKFTLTKPDTTTLTATTDSNGNAYFDFIVTNGTYKVTENLSSGYTNSTALSVTRQQPDANGPWTIWNVTFGNAPTRVIKVIKFHDLDHDGQNDSGEPLIPGWEFALYKWNPSINNWEQHLGGITGPNGFMGFTKLDAGKYKIVEYTQVGWSNTTPLEQEITLNSDDTLKTVEFGNVEIGNLAILKTLSNPGGATVPASFKVNYDCGAGYTGSVDVAPGSPATVNNIPTGNTCTVTEVAPAAIPNYTWSVISYTPTSVVISTKGGTFGITVGNSITRDPGSLQILKTLSNPGGATVPASFKVNYDCGAGYTGSVDVAPGFPATVNGIPTGNTCTVTEVAPAAIPNYTWGSISYTPASVVISTKGDTFGITVVNSITRDPGSLQILKTLSNPNGATVPASFKVNYDCGAGYTGSVDVAPGSPATVNNIPTGNTCTVNEPALTPISGFTWAPPVISPASILIGSTTGTFSLTVANAISRNFGALIITKVVDWNGITPDETQSFTICIQGPSFPLGSEPGACQTIDFNGGDLSWTHILPGNYTILETPGSAWNVTFNPQAVTVVANAESTVTAIVTNTRKLGSLEVIKIVEWNGITEETSKTFQICIKGLSFPNGNETGACQSIGSNGGTLSWTNLLPGNYIVSETDPGATEWDVTITGAGITVVPVDGTKATATVLNSRKVPTAISLIYFKVKSVNGLKISLEWKTGSETDNWGYKVYRSNTLDLSTAFLVGSQQAIDGHTPGTYIFTETLASKHPVYYWLSDIDLKGLETFHVGTKLDPSRISFPENQKDNRQADNNLGPVGVLENKVFIPEVTR